jgi:putative ubiquitin-RnfH superfamily antitoxin RatB of RatAB toxin-antitoxin module
MIHVEVAYALPEEQFLAEIEVDDTATAMDAIRQSGVFEKYPDLQQQNPDIGIFSRKVSPDTGLNDGDRIEIYRPLVVDPKEARRLRAAAKKKK